MASRRMSGDTPRVDLIGFRACRVLAELLSLPPRSEHLPVLMTGLDSIAGALLSVLRTAVLDDEPPVTLNDAGHRTRAPLVGDYVEYLRQAVVFAGQSLSARRRRIHGRAGD